MLGDNTERLFRIEEESRRTWGAGRRVCPLCRQPRCWGGKCYAVSQGLRMTLINVAGRQYLHTARIPILRAIAIRQVCRCSLGGSMQMKLVDMASGPGRVTAVDGDEDHERRLGELGIRVGAIVGVIQHNGPGGVLVAVNDDGRTRSMRRRRPR